MAVPRSPRFAGFAAFEMCLDGARMTVEGFDSNGDLAVDEPNDPAAVMAVQQALADLGYAVGVDGDYGSQTASVVRQFKNDQQLALPAGLAAHDGVTGPGTSGRLDELFSAFGVVRLLNEYGEALVGVVVELQDGDNVRSVVTGSGGEVLADLGGPWSLVLDPNSTLGAIGDLLGRPWPPEPPLDLSTATVTTVLTDVPVSRAAGDDLTVVVAARLDLSAELEAPLEGTVRIEGLGVRVSSDVSATVAVALQANGGFPVSVFVDSVSPSLEALPGVPEVPGWMVPDGYVVREGDTAAGLGQLFLDDPERFAELSDHDPVPGEVVTLPGEAVPGWLALATAELPGPQPQLWFEVTPDDVLRAFHGDGELRPLHDLHAVLDRPPAPAPDPAATLAARTDLLVHLGTSPEVLGPDPLVVVGDETDG